MNPIVPYYENDMFPEQMICLEPVREAYLYTLPGKEQYPLPCVHYTLWEHLVNESLGETKYQQKDKIPNKDAKQGLLKAKSVTRRI